MAGGGGGVWNSKGISLPVKAWSCPRVWSERKCSRLVLCHSGQGSEEARWFAVVLVLKRNGTEFVALAKGLLSYLLSRIADFPDALYHSHIGRNSICYVRLNECH